MFFTLMLLGAGYLVVHRTAREKPRESQQKASSPASAAPAEEEQSKEELAIARVSKQANLLLLGTTAGMIVSPVLLVVSTPFLVYQVFRLWQRAHREVTAKRKVGGDSVRALAATGMLASGAFWIMSVFGAIAAATDRLQLKVRRSSYRGLGSVFGELPRTAWVRSGGVDVERSLENLSAGDLVVIRAGEAIPVDGVIETGVASIDQQALTGEAQPVEKGPGDSVFAATVVLSGTIVVLVREAGRTTLVATIEDILHRTADYTSNLELKGQEIADKTIVPTLAMSATTLPLLGREAAVCMLALYPGEGMRVLGPLSLLNFLSRAARDRILVKDARALETLQDVDTVVFDKTGTLTEKIPTVAGVHVLAPETEERVLRYAAAAEAHQTHPIALAIKCEAKARSLTLPQVNEASYDIGFGISVQIESDLVLVGSARYLAKHDLEPPPDLQRQDHDSAEAGNSFVYVAIGSRVAGAIEFEPTIRREALPLIRALQKRGLQVYILSGDHESPTRRLAQDLGVDHFVAGTLPHEKAELIKRWQEEGKTVCFVGDGINDSIGLKTASVSVSLAGASTIAADTAEIVFMDASLEKLIPLFELADEVAANMRNNLIALLAPSPILLVGIVFLGFGYPATTLLVSASSLVGLANAARAGRGDLRRKTAPGRSNRASRRAATAGAEDHASVNVTETAT